VEIASIGIQVHGGVGYIEETGAAQYLRDARIAPIYEGTNGIQANDLVGRKLGRDQGEAAREFLGEMRASLPALAEMSALAPVARGLGEGFDALEHATAYLATAEPALAAAGSSPYLALFGSVAGGWLLARLAASAQQSEPAFAAAKLATARFFAEHFLARAPSYLPAILGGATVLGFDPELF